MPWTPHDTPAFGNEPPLVADRRRRPDRRQVSLRWLAGTLLTGLTSTAMMGVALSAAFDWRDSMASPASLLDNSLASGSFSEKGERVFATAVPVARSRQIIEVSMMTREGDREIVRTLPFAYVNMLLAARHQTNADYPAFDAMDVFADDSEPQSESQDEETQIYGASVESEISLKVEPFDFSQDYYDQGSVDAAESERLVRFASSTMAYEPVQVAALSPVDPSRFDFSDDVPQYEPGSAFRVVEENVSLALSNEDDSGARYIEEIIPFREPKPIAETLAASGHDGPEAQKAAARLAELLSSAELDAGDVLRVGIENRDDRAMVVRVSAYRGEKHMLTVAAEDDGGFEPATAPAMSSAIAEAFDENATEAPMRSDMPTVYDGIYQAALSYGLDNRLCKQLVRMLASEVDYQARLDRGDRLTVFYSLEEGKEEATDASEILYVEAKFGETTKRLYRFRTSDDDQIDYYDEEGRSAKQFLLRNPVPKGRFTSSFGSRRHPVLGYVRNHWGVDWAAPRGTPILASGAGTVERAGWSSGYGRQTLIRHPNGYETSYSHQSEIAKGVVPGAKVRQGQVIGYVGSTGLSTGNHLHYEVSVNGKKVDPMKIRLPAGRVLQGEELEAFKRERDRIDNLLRERVDEALVAGR